MTTDPLADVLRKRWHTALTVDEAWQDLAQAARERIAAEIKARMDAAEADGLDSTQLVWWWRGMDDAARIAQGST